MAVNSRNSFWSGLHLLTRLIGMTGVIAALAGWFIFSMLGDTQLGQIVLLSAAGAVAFALLFEIPGIVRSAFSHRGLFGFNVLLQIALALAIVIGANLYSFQHFLRFDLTRDQIFTLDEETRKQLEQLQGDTEIIVVQKHISFGQRSDNKQDKFDFAAERKIIEKINDLVEEFGDLGPRFRVRVLDIQDDNYDKKLEEVRSKVSPNLAKEIEKAPENSVFVYSKDKNRFQRISFSDIYQLDKQSSVANKNLVLKFQGVGPFARKIFNIEEKTPRIATAIIHPVLGFHDKRRPEFTMAGSKRILDAYGFDPTDIALRRLNDDGSLGDATVLTYDESMYEEIEDQLADLAIDIRDEEKAVEELNAQYKFWNESSMPELNKKYAYVYLPDGRQAVILRTQVEKIKKSVAGAKIIDVDEDDRKNMTTASKRDGERIKHQLDGDKEEQAQLTEKKGKLSVDSLAEKRRFTDLEAKAKAMLANVDLLIVPRITLIDVPQGEVIPNRIHKLETAQFNAIKSFIKQGKPVLFLLGPPNEARPDFGGGGADALEPMLGELGFYLPRQTILYNAEMREYNERKFGGFGASKREVDLPPLRFDETTSSYTWSKKKEPFSVHPIRTSMRLMNRAMVTVDPDAPKDKKDTTQLSDSAVIRVRHPRPVYFMRTTLTPESATGIAGSLTLPGLPGAVQAASIWATRAQMKPDDSAVFLLTREESWNEENPFIVQNKVPRYTPTKEDDPKKGTADEERRGPFPIGVAVETQVPASWMGKDEKAPEVRIAVIGSGGAFVGSNLPPLKEKLFLDTVNWLMGRDDLLARDAETWQYPRVELTPLEHKCWFLVCYGLPFAFVYLGTMVWLLRRMR